MAVQKKKSGIQKKAPAAQKVVTKKAAAKRATKGITTARAADSGKQTAKKAAAKKAPLKKVPLKKVPLKKVPLKKEPPKKAAPAKALSGKKTPQQTVTAKPAAAKPAAAKPAAAKPAATRKSASVKPAPKATPKKSGVGKAGSKKPADRKKGAKKTVKSTSELLKAIKERDIATGGSQDQPEMVETPKPARKKVAAKKPIPIIPPMQKPVEIVPTAAKAKPAKARLQFGKTELSNFRKELLLMRDHFAGQTHAMKHDALRRDDEVNPEEDGTDAFMRLQALSQMDDQQHAVAEIDDALNAIDKGNYGICQMCSCLISKQRLLVRPFAKFCVTCKSELENSGRHKKRH